MEKLENFKAQIKSFAITKGREEAARKNEKRCRLTETLCTLIEAEEERPVEFREDIRLIKQDLRGELEKGFWGALVRSREQRVQFEARPSRLFAAFEREHTAGKTITEVKHPAGIATGREEVAKAFADYYTDLFSLRTVPDTIPADVLNEIPKIPAESEEAINTPITEAEIERTMKNFPRIKSPGPHGIISEFYVAFRKELSPTLAMVFEDIKKRKCQPPSMRTSHLALIPNKVPTDSVPYVADYRPISLLATDYQILARILAGRLESALSAVVGPHRTCGFKGRSINSNLQYEGSLVGRMGIQTQPPIRGDLGGRDVQL